MQSEVLDWTSDEKNTLVRKLGRPTEVCSAWCCTNASAPVWTFPLQLYEMLALEGAGRRVQLPCTSKLFQKEKLHHEIPTISSLKYFSFLIYSGQEEIKSHPGAGVLHFNCHSWCSEETLQSFLQPDLILFSLDFYELFNLSNK